jgi:hypothetical protein
VLAPWLARVRDHQLFFAGMDSRRAAPRPMPRRRGEKGRPLKPPPPAAVRPGTGGLQLALFADVPARDYGQVRFDLRRGTVPASPWLAWALHLAHVAGEARGWQPVTLRGMQRILVTLLAGHNDGEAVALSAVHALARQHSVSSRHVTEILGAMEIVAEDRPDLFSSWLDARLAGLAAGIAGETSRWAVTCHPAGAPVPGPGRRARGQAGAIRALQLDDADLASGRLHLAGTDRPMGELSAKVVREWLEYRQHRWPHTANPHLLVSRESALHHGPVSTAYLTSLRGLPATLERLRIDCQLAQAMATGFDPLHLAEVFGISEHTAIRYAVNARQLLGAPHQAAAPGSPAASARRGRITPHP